MRKYQRSRRKPFEGWLLPAMVIDPLTGELVRPSGPPRFISRRRRGRPPVPLKDAIAGIIDAEIAKRLLRSGRKPKTELAAEIAAQRSPTGKATAAETETVARWLREPSRSLPPKLKR